MITTVTPAPALDITYTIPELVIHQTNRIQRVMERPGGKGLNVARLLAAAGHEVSATGFLGGTIGDRLAGLLHEQAPTVHQNWCVVGVETRRTINVTDGQDATMFNEPAAPVTPKDWQALQATVGNQTCGPVVVSGSLPRESPTGCVGTLVTAAHAAGRRIIIDTTGPYLLEAARSNVDLVKPNQNELRDLAGHANPLDGARYLIDEGCYAVAVSLGRDGIVLVTRDDPHHAHQASLGRDLAGNPTGAGDAAVAAFAAHWDSHPEQDLVSALSPAVADSAAAVLNPVAGEIDLRIAAQLLNDITTRRI
ncbi:hexose kinase [Cutibacterium avidum]|uniref:1-phosphofructokinase family hexose kinase n=1 Tax=Cutibacterium avidum TaxID=33010 RepID=UPI00192B4CE6|nr:hexose kinase [Cutibacterium avidum]QQY15579.1 hexose kinase [Cutibacterium avidum]